MESVFPFQMAILIWRGQIRLVAKIQKHLLYRWPTIFCPVYRTYSLIESRHEVGVTIITPNGQQATFYLQYDDDGDIVFIEYLEGSR